MSEYLEIIKILADLGGTAVVAVTIIVCIYKLTTKFAERFLVNMERIAGSIGEQASSMQQMSVAINQSIGRDNAEHREILLAMQVVGEELKTVVHEIRCLREDVGK